MTYTYTLSRNAKEDLKRIYIYGLAEFGEEQADKYFHYFFESFDKITSNPFSYQSIDQIRSGYRRCPSGTDSIFFKLNNSTVEIMAILGGQDVDSWL